MFPRSCTTNGERKNATPEENPKASKFIVIPRATRLFSFTARQQYVIDWLFPRIRSRSEISSCRSKAIAARRNFTRATASLFGGKICFGFSIFLAFAVSLWIALSYWKDVSFFFPVSPKLPRGAVESKHRPLRPRITRAS
jgi:hypothetical protein